MSNDYYGAAGRFYWYCADCGKRNHTTGNECSRCGEYVPVGYKSNVGKSQYTSDGDSGTYIREDDGTE